MHNRWWPDVSNCCAMAKPMPREAPVKMVRCCFMDKILAKSASPNGARHDSSVTLCGANAVDLQRRDFAGLVAPLGAQVREHRCNIAIVQLQNRWRHAEGLGVRCRGRAIAAVQDHLHQIGRVVEQYGAVTCEGRVGDFSRCRGHALALLTMALNAMSLIDFESFFGGQRAH